MKNKIISAKEAAAMIKSGDTVMVGGFLGNGSPERITDEMLKTDVKDLTIIANDTSFPGLCISRLIENHRVKKVIASHIGTNPETGRQMSSGEMEVQLTPQGTLIEQIRAAGFGLGGILTPTGIGTDVEKGKEKLTLEGKEYLLEMPLRGNVAILQGAIVDKMGNVFFKGSSRNFCPYICMAADLVVVEAEKIVEPGEIPPESVHVQCVLVDYIVQGGAE